MAAPRKTHGLERDQEGSSLVLKMDHVDFVTVVSLDVHSQPRLTFRRFVAVGTPIWTTIVMDVSDVRAQAANAREGFLTEATHNETNV